ncbi:MULTISPECIES: ABC transporter ATP-binding protein [Tenacibaculum]|uniref:ABC transporter ATP-binding protein n=1 Tax=Tenacibaculum TaxID=104267 RepID=UPI00089A29CA|nr:MULTISPECIES: ATP-binding cassette domain-containing protein [unclassified Tenacibaculum]RBW59844.1 ATP-binding cassette domain-containing protein [Tenacibaculum sp. E3R01]SED37162.1 ABC-2 type transport system ATP-binding protein [Tenacibaculum sp. MAR_2010_89]
MNQLIVETKNLNFSYSKSRKDIESLALQVPKGSVYGFLGPNGSGKSTTIRLILGLLKKQAGEVSLFGKPFNAGSRIKSLNKIGALIENPSLYEHLNAVENLKIAANYRGGIPLERIEEVIEIVRLTHAKKKKVKAYSLGMKQRLGLAISLLSNPELIILDEPTNGLDPKGIIEMRELIKELNEKYGTTVFISSHLLSEIEKTCTHVGIIRNGKMLYQDTVKSLKQSKSKNMIVEIEVDKFIEAMVVLESLNKENMSSEDDFIQIEVEDKEEITKVIDAFRANKVQVFQASIKNNLEELFLSLTEN